MDYCLGDSVAFYHKIRRIEMGSGVQLGDSYTVYKDKLPYLEVTVPCCDWNQEFNRAYIFKTHLCVGLGQAVFFISIETGEIQEIQVSMYFGYFYEHEDRLYVASGDRVYCFNSDCALIWSSDYIAVDGVIIAAFEKDAILVSCEMDPLGGWSGRRLSLTDGKEME